MYTGSIDMEMKREAASNDSITECCSHDYKPAVGMFVCFPFSAVICQCIVFHCYFYLNMLC